MRNDQRSTYIIYLLLILLAVCFISPVMAEGGDPDAAARAWPMIEDGALVLDVRSAEEFAEGHLDGAVNIEWDKTDALATAIGDDKQRAVVLYCRSGNRAGKSKTELEARGYTHIFNASGLEALLATKDSVPCHKTKCANQ